MIRVIIVSEIAATRVLPTATLVYTDAARCSLFTIYGPSRTGSTFLPRARGSQHYAVFASPKCHPTVLPHSSAAQPFDVHPVSNVNRSNTHRLVVGVCTQVVLPIRPVMNRYSPIVRANLS